MKLHSIIILFLISFISTSCFEDDIYKTKSDEYASKKGNFVAKFPKEPKHSIIENKIGTTIIPVNVYLCSLNSRKFFSVELIEYNNNEIENFSDEEIFKQLISNTLFLLKNEFKVEYEENITQNNLSGKLYILEFNEIKRRNEGFVMMKLFRIKNKLYKVSYTGVDDKSVDSFMKSFRILKKN